MASVVQALEKNLDFRILFFLLFDQKKSWKYYVGVVYKPQNIVTDQNILAVWEELCELN